MIVVCAWCKAVMRDDDGNAPEFPMWWVDDGTGAEDVSHGMCPKCETVYGPKAAS